MLHRVDAARQKFDVVSGERSEEQARSRLLHVHVDHLERLAAEENVRRLVSGAALGLFIVGHRLGQPNCGRRLLIVVHRDNLDGEQVVEPDDVTRFVEKKLDSVEAEVLRETRVERLDYLQAENSHRVNYLAVEGRRYVTSQYPKKEWSVVALQLIAILSVKQSCTISLRNEKNRQHRQSFRPKIRKITFRWKTFTPFFF